MIFDPKMWDFAGWQANEEEAIALEKRIRNRKEAAGTASEAKNALPEEPAPLFGAAGPDWQEIIRRTDEGFSDALLRMIDEKGMKDSECYKKANVDRRLFSKIRSDPDYRPSKPTALKLCLALELTSQQTQEMLNTLGYGMSNASMVDKIIMFFIEHDDFDIFKIDEKIREITEQRYLIENL